MEQLIAYMLTWTTYGTWLQGDSRGWVKNSRVLGQNNGLKKSNTLLLKKEPVKLGPEQKQVVAKCIEVESQRLGHKIFALAVCSDHVHVLLETSKDSPAQTAQRYKRITTHALQKNGMTGKVWTKGYDKRYCFTPKVLTARIAYIERHKPPNQGLRAKKQSN